MRDLALQVLLNLYNLGVERSRAAYYEDRLHEDGTCIECGERPSGFARRCRTCRGRRERELGAARKRAAS